MSFSIHASDVIRTDGASSYRQEIFHFMRLRTRARTAYGMPTSQSTKMAVNLATHLLTLTSEWTPLMTLDPFHTLHRYLQDFMVPQVGDGLSTTSANPGGHQTTDPKANVTVSLDDINKYVSQAVAAILWYGEWPSNIACSQMT